MNEARYAFDCTLFVPLLFNRFNSFVFSWNRNWPIVDVFVFSSETMMVHHSIRNFRQEKASCSTWAQKFRCWSHDKRVDLVKAAKHTRKVLPVAIRKEKANDVKRLLGVICKCQRFSIVIDSFSMEINGFCTKRWSVLIWQWFFPF